MNWSSKVLKIFYQFIQNNKLGAVAFMGKTTCILYISIFITGACLADDDDGATVEEDIGKSREGSKTDDEVVQRYC